MPSGAPSAGLDFVTSGTYQRASDSGTGLNLVADTEVELPLLATNIVCTEDALLSWVRYQFALYGTDEGTAYEWFCIKCQSSEGLQNMSDSTVVEDLQREKRIFGRGFIAQGALAYGKPKIVKLEFFNVKLIRGEELRLVVRPYLSNTAGHTFYIDVLEWRQVGA